MRDLRVGSFANLRHLHKLGRSSGRCAGRRAEVSTTHTGTNPDTIARLVSIPDVPPTDLYAKGRRRSADQESGSRYPWLGTRMGGAVRRWSLPRRRPGRPGAAGAGRRPRGLDGESGEGRLETEDDIHLPRMPLKFKWTTFDGKTDTEGEIIV